MLPRWLYLAMFVWLAAPGRFTALYFSNQGLSDTQVGVLMALMPLVCSVCGPVLALIADKAEAARAPLLLLPAWHPATGFTLATLRGHEGVLGISVIASTASFLLFGCAPRHHSSGKGEEASQSFFAFFVGPTLFGRVDRSLPLKNEKNGKKEKNEQF